jgi:hypothetical protein
MVEGHRIADKYRLAGQAIQLRGIGITRPGGFDQGGRPPRHLAGSPTNAYLMTSGTRNSTRFAEGAEYLTRCMPPSRC